MSDLKTSLKEAKNAIKDKDYEAAMIHCKDVLKIEKKNYQALAMLGRVFIEERRFADSKKTLLLATQVDPENSIAWLGLSNLHEKCADVFDDEEAINVLKEAIKFTKEDEKARHLYRKLSAIHRERGDLREAVSSLENLIPILCDRGEINSTRSAIIQVLEQDESNAHYHKVIEHYQEILKSTSLSENEYYHKKYIQYLYEQQLFKELIQAARDMYKEFPTAFPLEWIIRSYVELNGFRKVDSEEGICISEEDISTSLIKLEKLLPNSPWLLLCQGMLMSERNEVEAAKISMRKGCDMMEKNINAWYLYLELLQNSFDNEQIVHVCSRITAISGSEDVVGGSREWPSRFRSWAEFKKCVYDARVKSLFNLGRRRNFEEILNLSKNAGDMDTEMQVLLVKSRLKLGLLDEAGEALDEIIRDVGEESSAVQHVRALLASARGCHSQAKAICENALQKDPENSAVLFELGRVYFSSGDLQSALLSLLKAAKIEPKMSAAYLYIGFCYRQSGNSDKARKCFEKALSLNPSCDDAALALSDVYRISGQNEENFNLLIRLTSEGKSDWAWLRLGLHYLSVKTYDEAIKALQRAMDFNPNDRITCECLGDAYLARGSHNAALKVYSKVVEQHPGDSLYSRCRIARIYHLLGDHLLSISQYESVISEAASSEAILTVALAGLADSLLARAKAFRQDKIFLNAKEHCLRAIESLSRAASINPKSVTIWKLLGDACTLLASTPPSLASFHVPKKLLDPASTEDANGCLDIKAVLELGARCYGVGLKISETNASLWHDLGLNIFLQGYVKLAVNLRSKTSPDDQRDWSSPEMKEDYAPRAAAALSRSIQIDPENHNAWNTLGVVAFFKDDLALVQHAFIQSLNVCSTAEGWAHLGVLYLHRDEIQLAHEAFSQGQAVDPKFISNWIGQATVATSIGHHEALDLFRHTTLLGIHPESSVGFSRGILSIACDGENEEQWRNHEKFLSNVHDCLTFYCREKEQDLTGLLMLGVASRMMNLNRNASDTLTKALQLCNDNTETPEALKDMILSNLGDISLSVDRLSDAVSCFSMIKEPNFYSQCAIARAKIKAGMYEEACQTYTEACQWFSADSTQESHIYTSLAFLFYKFGKIDEAKDYLFKSCSIGSTFECRAALMALGLVQRDKVLTDAALSEINPSADTEALVHHVAFLKSALAVLENKPREAKLILSEAIHRHPHNGHLWRQLSRRLLSASSSTGVDINAIKGAVAASSAARVLAQSSCHADQVLQDMVSKTIAFLKLSHVTAAKPSQSAGKGNKRSAKKRTDQPLEPASMRKRRSLVEAQRSVLMCPGKPESWAVLMASLDEKELKRKIGEKWMGESGPKLREWMLQACD